MQRWALVCLWLGVASIATAGTRAFAQSAAAPAPAAAPTPAPAPAPVPYVAPAPMLPPTPPARHRRKQGLMIAGLAVLGGGYLSSLFTYASTNTFDFFEEPAPATLLIPVAGPWLVLASRDLDKDGHRIQGAIDVVVFGFQGLLQTTGLVLSVIGISQYVESAPRDSQPATRALTLTLAPTSGGGMQGLVLGAF